MASTLLAMHRLTALQGRWRSEGTGRRFDAVMRGAELEFRFAEANVSCGARAQDIRFVLTAIPPEGAQPKSASDFAVRDYVRPTLTGDASMATASEDARKSCFLVVEDSAGERLYAYALTPNILRVTVARYQVSLHSEPDGSVDGGRVVTTCYQWLPKGTEESTLVRLESI